ncbi:nucleotidyltransferase domain-containing protein [uncultured Acetatifactor sp.]|uniref:nucleotidyltransferase domain-containing protein n=1 Tax=uncultured Acetatifactor sp. TaxID=1671927 RepID=UPI00260D25E5|nr:nucleotidyltransferase domain-containing protein [uncultured Acetatifactor sp.]
MAVIVFGSAVRFDCHSRSDLDVLVVRDDRQLAIDGSLDEVSSELDIIFSSHLGSRLKEEIAQTGVVVYRRNRDV